MSISARRQRETAQLRQRVLDAAEEIIAREGAQRVTMRRIAAAVDYSQTVLYRLFADKSDLMDHLIARGYRGVRECYAVVLDQAGDDPLQTLRHLLAAYAGYALAHPNHYRMWFETGELSWADGRLVMRHGALHFEVFGAWLESISACQKAGHFAEREPLEVFQTLWTRMHGCLSLRLQQPGFPWLPLERQLADLLFLERSPGA